MFVAGSEVVGWKLQIVGMWKESLLYLTALTRREAVRLAAVFLTEEP